VVLAHAVGRRPERAALGRRDGFERRLQFLARQLERFAESVLPLVESP